MTQSQAIIEYLSQGKTLTPLVAVRELGITKLATRVSELNRAGYNIKKRPIKVTSRYTHRMTTVMSYSLED